MRASVIITALMLSVSSIASAQAPAANAAKYSTAETTIGDLLDNPAAKQVLAKHLPEVVSSDQIEMARGMTLQNIKDYAPDQVTDAKLAQIDAELAKLN